MQGTIGALFCVFWLMTLSGSKSVGSPFSPKPSSVILPSIPYSYAPAPRRPASIALLNVNLQYSIAQADGRNTRMFVIK